MSTPYQNYGSGDGYGSYPYSQGAGSPQQMAERDPLTSQRHFAGGLDWPLALRYLTRDGEAKELRERIDAQVKRLRVQPTDQEGSSDLLQKVRGDVENLRKRLEREGRDMPTSRQQEADGNPQPEAGVRSV
jgi:hypothetical protein